MLQLVRVKSSRYRYHVIRSDGLPDEPLTAFIEEQCHCLAEGSVSLYARELLAFLNWSQSDPIAVRNGFNRVSRTPCRLRHSKHAMPSDWTLSPTETLHSGASPQQNRCARSYLGIGPVRRAPLPPLRKGCERPHSAEQRRPLLFPARASLPRHGRNARSLSRLRDRPPAGLWRCGCAGQHAMAKPTSRAGKRSLGTPGVRRSVTYGASPSRRISESNVCFR